MSNKTKRIIGFSLLLINLIIIQLFNSGAHLYHFWEELIPNILLLLIVSFVLMIVPLVFKLVNKARMEYKRGKLVCLLNSLILFVLFSTPSLLIVLKGNNDMKGMSINPISFSSSLILVFFIIAVVYYFINMCFFVDNKK